MSTPRKLHRFRVEPVTDPYRRGDRIRWRVVDDARHRVIWAGGTLGQANTNAYKLNHDHLRGHDTSAYSRYRTGA